MGRPERIHLQHLTGSDPAELLAWDARALALGATPTAAKRAAMEAFYVGLAADGFLAESFTSGSALYILVGTNPADTAANRLNEARINILVPGTFDATITSAVGAGNLADSGITGDGTMYWSTGIVPSVDFAGIRTDDVSVLAAVIDTVAAANVADIGNEGSHQVVSRWGDNNFYSMLNAQLLTAANAVDTAALFTTTSQGGTMRSYKGATQQATAARSGSTDAAFELLCFGRMQNTGTPGALSSRKYGAFGVTRGLTAAQMTALYGRLQTLLATFGATI